MRTFVQESPMYEGMPGELLEYSIFVVAAIGLAAAVAIATLGFARPSGADAVGTFESSHSATQVWKLEAGAFDYMWKMPR